MTTSPGEMNRAVKALKRALDHGILPDLPSLIMEHPEAAGMLFAAVRELRPMYDTESLRQLRRRRQSESFIDALVRETGALDDEPTAPVDIRNWRALGHATPRIAAGAAAPERQITNRTEPLELHERVGDGQRALNLQFSNHDGEVWVSLGEAETVTLWVRTAGQSWEELTPGGTLRIAPEGARTFAELIDSGRFATEPPPV